MKYLVIQTHDIGDVLISTALCDALKLRYPEADIDFLVEDRCAGVVEGNPNISEIILLNKSRRSNLRYALGLLNYIRVKKYDSIFNIQGQAIGLLVCLFSLSSRRIGSDKFPWRLAHSEIIERPWWLAYHTGQNDYPPSQCTSGLGLTIDYRFNFLSKLSADIKSRPFRLWLNDSEIKAGKELLEYAGIDPDIPTVILGINAQHNFKRWPIENFARVASWLFEKYGVQIFVYFGPGEEEYTKRLKFLIPEEYRHLVFDNVRTKSIRQLAQVFCQCSLYVGNETGPRHIAQSLDIPAFAVVSPSSNKWAWIPWDNPRFQAVDTGDAMGLSNTEWLSIRSKLTQGVDDTEWHLKIKPEFVKSQLGKMIDDLKLFQ